MKRTVSMLTVTLLLVSMFTAAFSIRAVETGLSQLTVPDEPATMQETMSLASQEPPPTEWNKTYGGTDIEGALSVVQSDDGGYALAGATASSGAGGYDFWLIKTDANGNAQWNKTYGGTDDELPYVLVQTVDGGYALAGETSSFGAGLSDFWLVKTDAAGNKEWSTTCGGIGYDMAEGLVQTVDGGYALAGTTYSFGGGPYDAWLVKIDVNGIALWNKRYGGWGGDSARDLVQTVDGGYALAGGTGSFGAGDQDFWLIKTDANGNAQWNKTYGGTGYDSARDLVQTVDGGYALAGTTNSSGAGDQDFWLIKTDANGNAQWNKTYGGTGYDWAWSLVQTVDGGYALAGETSSFGAGLSDFWLIKTDANGNAQWNKTYGGTSRDIGLSVIQTTDDGYAVAGCTESSGAGYEDFWLVKLGPSAPPPEIIAIDPSQPIASSGKQLLSILGEGFVPNSEVTLCIGSDTYHIPGDRTLFISPSEIRIIAGLGADPGLWKALVTNPVNIQSNEYSFQVRSVLDEDIRKVLALALQYWTAEDAVKMTAIAGGESGWRPNTAFDEGNYPFNYMGHDSWGLWQIFMNVHKEMLGTLGAPIEDASLTAKWLLNPNNNAKAAYEVWKEAKRILGDGFLRWSAYTQKNAPNYYKNPSIWNRVINVAKQMGISVFKCPVNVTITDDYGRVISEVENQIPGAIYEYFDTTDTKIFYLPLALTYYVQTNATDNGNITISQITPLESIYEIAFSNVAFNLTSETVAEFDLMPYDANYTLRVDEDSDGLIDCELTPEVEILTTEYDVGITGIVPSKATIGEGYNLPLNMTAMNYGAYTETFNVTIYANDTFIEQQTVILTNGTSTALTFIWNTTGFARGNYTISAYASPVSGETDTNDNLLTDGWVFVAMPGDINADKIVNIIDIVRVALAFGAVPANPNWDPNADINGDKVINIVDIAIVALHFGETG